MSGTWYPSLRDQIEAELRPVSPQVVELFEHGGDWDALEGLVRDEWDDWIAALRERPADNDELPAWAS